MTGPCESHPFHSWRTSTGAVMCESCAELAAGWDRCWADHDPTAWIPLAEPDRHGRALCLTCRETRTFDPCPHDGHGLADGVCGMCEGSGWIVVDRDDTAREPLRDAVEVPLW